MYLDGKEINRDYKEAFKWAYPSAEKGHIIAQNMLGEMYEYGYGVKMDVEEAAHWYRLAAKQGSLEAKDSLIRLGKN